MLEYIVFLAPPLVPYSGYNQAYTPAKRQRAGCLAHVRRKFFDARTTAEVAADEAMGLILEVYRIEQKAREQSGPIFNDGLRWPCPAPQRYRTAAPALLSPN